MDSGQATSIQPDHTYRFSEAPSLLLGHFQRSCTAIPGPITSLHRFIFVNLLQTETHDSKETVAVPEH
ncbi:hypothetical protein IAQ61_001647 [Plenodomus lingam]|uniref:Uncharacterized protein n=1 Tax=Leptosphaeria maculans (strain JN3 / isolate v23.1.3 / race Av1-4-5-6-7-8) TaxID=985895 RepID=M1ZIM3_LEPMJ|nr:hypothetical protein IAQ61_001647 [Plenodomus lingam]CCT61092.1 predicted protein [Plenodomus lingam JN3]